MEKFLLDMHMHTKETSSCGEVPAAEGVRLYKEAGYQGVMITDHYHKQYFDSLGDIGMPRKVDAYLAGWRAAKAEGDKIGLEVLLGIEFRNVESENDFLIVGMTEEFLYKSGAHHGLEGRKALQQLSKHRDAQDDEEGSAHAGDSRRDLVQIPGRRTGGRASPSVCDAGLRADRVRE